MKEIFTSSFFNPRIKGGKLDGHQCVSIARRAPDTFEGIKIPKLAPSLELLDDYRSGKISWDQYCRRYARETLLALDAQVCGDLLVGRVLLCWEKSSNRKCHRHLVATWLRRAGFKVTELW